MSSYTPVIEFDKMYFRHGFVGKTFKEIHEDMEARRKSVKKALDYMWDNSHFRVRDSYGKPALQIAFYDDDMSFWNFQTGDSLGVFRNKENVFTREMADEIENMVEFVESGKRKCCDCGKWVKSGETYSFAGFVCEECFDPDRHQAPDTSGD
jgi:hypothetical protein